MRAGRIRPGLAALLRISGTRIETVASMDLGFGVAPRLNAAGRLEDISLGIDCLLAQDDNKAGDLATQLDQLNLERRDIEKEIKPQALASLGSIALALDAFAPKRPPNHLLQVQLPITKVLQPVPLVRQSSGDPMHSMSQAALSTFEGEVA